MDASVLIAAWVMKLTPTVGLSAIDLDYLDYATFFLAPYDNQASLTNANSLLWTPEPELTFFDLGAYEFQGKIRAIRSSGGCRAGQCSRGWR